MTESRADQVIGLRNELAYLERTPNPNKQRIADVKAQLDHFESEPKQRSRETAAKGVADPEADQGVHIEHKVTHDDDPKPAKKTAAKKAPAKKATARKRTPAKKTAEKPAEKA